MPTVDKAPEFLLGAFVGEGNIETFTLDANATAVAKADLLKLNGDLQVTNVSAGDKVVGVALKSAIPGEGVPCLVRGKVKLKAAGAISAGAAIKSGGPSTVAAAVNTVTIPTGATAVTSSSAQPSMTIESSIGFGVALQAATGANDTILCSINAV